MTPQPPSPGPDPQSALVARWLASEEAPQRAGLPRLDAAGTLALAWALKTACHQVWNSSPGQAVQAARWLALLADSAAAGPEVQALAQWTAGLAALVGGDMVQALQALEAASAGFDANAQPLFAAQAGVPQLIALSMLGRHDEAIGRAGELRQRLADGGDLHAAGKVDLNRGSMLLRLDRYQEAAQSYRQAAVVFARAGDIEHSVMADIGLAATLSWQFDFGEAGRMLARARQRAAAHGLPVLEGLACGELGQLALHRGERSQALREFEAARRLLAGRAHPQRLLEADRALADAYLGVRLLPEAQQLYSAVIEAAQALQAPVEAAWAQLQLAQTLLLQQQPERADSALAQARASFASHGNAIGQARADLLLARRALAGGEPLAALQGARAAARTLAGAQAAGWHIEAELVRAQALAALGRPVRAAALLAQLAAAAERAGALPQRPWCALARAELAEQRGDTHRARRHYQQAAALFEHLRALLPPGELRVASALDAERAADALVRLAAPGGGTAALLQQMEQARARALHDRWRDDAAHGGRPAEPAATARQPAAADPLRARLNWLYRQWQLTLLAGPPQAGRAAEMLVQVRAAETAWQAQQRHRLLQAHGAPARGAAAGEAPLDVAALQAALGPSRALLAYHLDGEAWRACVVRHDGLQRVEGRLPALNERLLQLRLQLAAMRRPGAAGQRHAPQLLQRARHLLRRFDDDLLAPLRAALGGVRQLVIVPHRGLHALPWAALVDESGHSLLERRELVVAPSATTWLHCHSRALQAGPGGGTALLVGAGGPTLPAVAQEIAAVHAAIGPQARLLQGEQASIAGFLAHAGEAETLHLACHASCRADNPDFSALHFSDGAWTLADASALPLRARLVTLSACDTAVSRIAPGDEVLGLARGFLLAGAHAVVATLWSVEDGSTAELMAAFYRARQRGQAVAAALRQAQLELAARHPHPFFWAPFVAYGHG